MDLDKVMAGYTQFGVSEDRVVFLLTPLGGYGAGAGYREGRYFLCERESGKYLGGGRYSFPEEDSTILFSRGQAFAFRFDEGGACRINRITFGL